MISTPSFQKTLLSALIVSTAMQIASQDTEPVNVMEGNRVGSIEKSGVTDIEKIVFPELSQAEKEEGWKLLFDGKTTNGWKRFNGDPFPESGWKIDQGVLTIVPVEGGKGLDIVTGEEFSDFEFSVEFRVDPGANSGIKYFLLQGTNLGLEYQLLDDAIHPDANMGKDGNRLQGSLYDLIAPVKDKQDKPAGEWNEARIKSKGRNVEHWLNGQLIVSYKRGSKPFRELVSQSKYKDIEGFATPDKSPILLQHHGYVVAFRNIRIRNL